MQKKAKKMQNMQKTIGSWLCKKMQKKCICIPPPLPNDPRICCKLATDSPEQKNRPYLGLGGSKGGLKRTSPIGHLAHWLLGVIPLTTNCWPEAPSRGGGGGLASWDPRSRPPPPPTVHLIHPQPTTFGGFHPSKLP